MLWQERGVVNSVVELVSSSVGLVVYRREEGGEIMNTEQTKHHKIYQGNTRCSVCPNAVLGDTGEGGKHPGKYSRCFAFSDRGTGREMLQVHYAMDEWRTNGLRIWIRFVILSNFHVQSFFIRATVYFI